MSHSFFQLEPRLLFDASAADTADHVHDDGAHAQFPGLAFVQDHGHGDAAHSAEASERAGLEASAEDASRVEIFVIDASVRDSAEIEKALHPGAVVIRLEAGTDGITALSDALAGYSQIDALHIFSHGVDGEVRLGSSILDGQALAERGGQIAGWGSSFSAGGDILLYGCDVAKSETGLAFVTGLAELTRTDVAASTDATGSADKGGNWDLEFAYGNLETRGVVAGGYADLLDAPHITGVENFIRMGFEDTDLLVQWARIDTSAETISMVIKADHGTLHLQTTDGLTFDPGYENGTSELRFSGTRSAINMALLGHTNDSGGGNNQSMIYRPEVNFNGRATLTMKATADDQSSEKTFQLEFAPVNDAPDLSTQVPAQAVEGGSVSFSLAQLATDANALDPDIATGQQVAEQLMVVVESLPAQGKLTYKGGVVAKGAVIPVTNLSELVYTHNGTDLTNNITDSFNVTVSDGGGDQTTGKISITVAPKNMAPSIGSEPIHILEGQVKAVAPSINLGDAADTLENSTIVIDNIVTGGQGTFFFDANGNNVIDAGEELNDPVTLTPEQAKNIATGLKFFHNGAEPNAPGVEAPSFHITVTDSGGGLGESAKLTASQTVTLAVEPVNDDPTMETNVAPTAGDAMTVEEHSSTILTPEMLKVTDVDRNPTNIAETTPPNQLVYTVESPTTQGELRLTTGSGYIVLGVGGRFTQADIDSGKVAYVQTTNIPEGPAVADKFSFTVRDSAFGYDMRNPASPGPIREGAIRDADGNIEVKEFHFRITPQENVDEGTDPGQPSISYDFKNSGTSDNSPVQWNEDNVGAAGGRYLLTPGMLNYNIKRISDGHVETLDPQEIVYTLTTVPANGTLYQHVDGKWGPMTPGSVFTQADINEGRVSFVSDGGETHTSSFEFKVSDGTVEGTRNGTFGIEVEPTNDRPVATGGEAQVPEGNGNVVRLGSSVLGMSDVDTDPARDALWFQITNLPAHGTLQHWDGTAWVAVQTGEWLSQDVLTATADGGTSGLRYVHDGSEPLSYAGGPKVTFDYVVRDDLAAPAEADRFKTSTDPVAGTMPGGGETQSHQSAPGTATVNILPINNPPQVADKPGDPDPTISGTIANGGVLQGKNEPLVVPEGGWVLIDSNHLTAIDSDNTTVQRQYRITQAPTQGWLFLGEKALNVGSTFTQKDIDEGRLHYWHDGKEVAPATTDTLGTYNDKFHFIVSDGVLEDRGADANHNVFLITLGDPENDIPEVTPSQSTLDVFSGTGEYVSIPPITVADADLDVVTSGEKDFLRVEISVVDAGGALVAGAKLTYTAADPSNPVSEGAYLSGKDSNSLVVQGTHTEVQAILKSLQVAMTADRDSTTDKIKVVVDDRLRDSSGNLVLVDGKEVANGGKVNEVPHNGDPLKGTVNETNNRVTVDIALRSSVVNDPPSITNSNAAYTVHEDKNIVLSGYTLSDVDSFDQDVKVIVELFEDADHTLLADKNSQGRLVLGAITGVTATGNNSNTVTLTGKMADVQNALNALKFQGAPDYNGPDQGNGALYLRTTFTDFAHGDADSANQSVTLDRTITIVPVNDRPTLTVPGNKVMKEKDSTSINISGFKVSDTKDTNQGATDFITVTLTAKDGANLYGKLNITNANGAELDGDGSSVVKVSGTAAQVQAALNTLVYTPDNPNVDKVITVNVVADDRVPSEGNKGNGTEGVGVDGNNTVSKPFTITISNVNDAPTVVTSPSAVTIPEDTSLVFDGISGPGHAAKIEFTDSDSFSFTNNTVTIFVPVGTVAVTPSGTVVAEETIDNSGHRIVLKGSLTNINNTLKTLKYTPDADYNSETPVKLEVTYNDGGNLGDGGPKEVTATVDITVTPVNDAPTRTDGALVMLPEINEDNPSESKTIADLVGPKFQDLKDDQSAHSGSISDTFYGVVVVGNAADSANDGTWEYLDGGAWKTIPNTVSEADGFVLTADTQIRFNPKSGWSGTPGGLTTRLIETGGETLNTGVRKDVSGTNSGGSTIYSDADNEVGISVTIGGVNDPGHITANDFSVPEGGSNTTDGNATIVVIDATNANIDIDDPDHGDANNLTATVTVTQGYITAVGGSDGTVTGAGPTSQEIVITGTLAEINSRLQALTITLPGTDKANWNGSFDVTVVYNDQGNTGKRPGSIWYDTNDPIADPGDFSYADESPGSTNAALITTRKFTVTVDPVNDAPTRIGEEKVSLEVEEDTDAPAGKTVEDLFGSRFSDAKDAVDGGSSANNFAGIAITANNAIPAQGKWQYSDDDGGNWKDLPAVSDSNALLLKATDKLRFVPAPNFHGDPGSLVVRLVDDSQGALTTGDRADVSNDTDKSGGITRYSNSGNAVTLTPSVTSVNDRPTATDATLKATTEDEGNPPGYAVSDLGFGYSDATDNQKNIHGGDDKSTPFGGIAIVGNAATALQGVWQYNVGSGWVDIDAPSDGSAIILPITAQLRFLPAENYNGTPGGLSIRVADTDQNLATEQDISTKLGQTSTWSEVVTLSTTVNPQNDAPTLTHTASNPTFSEDTPTAVKLLNPGQVSDVDLSTTAGLDSSIFGAGRITVTLGDGIEGDVLEINGVLPAGVIVAGGEGSTPLIITLDNDTTLDEVKAILESIQYKNTSDNPDNYGANTTRNYSIVLSDGNNVQAGGDAGGENALEATITGTITISATNDPPTATNNKNEVFEDADPNTATGNVITDDPQDSDPDNTIDKLKVTGIRTGAESGTGTAGTVGVRFEGVYGHLTLNADGTYTYELDNNNPAVNGLKTGETLTETFTYTLSDPAGLTDTAELTITINGHTDGEPRITPVDGNAGAIGHATVYESGLVPGGPVGQSETVTGVIDLSISDGMEEVTIAGKRFTVAQLNSFSVDKPSAPIFTDHGELRLTGLTDVTGSADAPTGAKLNYSYTLTKPLTNSTAAETDGTEDISLILRDVHNDEGTGTLTIRIVDDIPTARDDAHAVTEGPDATTTGNVLTGTTDGDVADRLGADDPTTVTAFSFTNPDTSVVTDGVLGSALGGRFGSLTLNADGSYTYALDNTNAEVRALQNGESLTETFSYTITDADGDTSTANLTITIKGTNTAPEAKNNANSVTEDAVSNTATGNMRTDKDPDSGLDSDPDNTIDELTVTGIRPGAVSAGGDMTTTKPGSTSTSDFVEVTGAYGVLKIGADGSYVYELDNSNPAVNALKDGETLTETFTYALSDPGGLSDTAELVITINGKTDGDSSITPVDANGGSDGHADVYESGLTDNGPAGESKTVTGEITLSAPDGLKEVTIGGHTFTVAELAALSASSPSGVIDTGEGELQVIGLNVIAGDASAPTSATLEYRYTLKAALDNSGAGEDIARTDDISLSITDMTTDAKPVEGMLTIRIVDDIPTAKDDVHAVTEGPDVTPTTTTGNVLTGTTDGDVADRLGADDPTTVTAFSFTNPDTSVVTDGVLGSALGGRFGSLTLNADGSYTYALDNTNAEVRALQNGESLTETFSYTITDADGDTSTANLTITIKGTNTAPEAKNNVNSVTEDAVSNTATGNVRTDNDPDSGLDSDPDNTIDELTVTGIRPGAVSAGGDMTTTKPGSTSTSDFVEVTGAYGVLKIGADGSYVYELDNSNPAVNALKDGETLKETFTYTLSDPGGLSDTAELVITINGKTDGDSSITPVDANGGSDGHADVYESGLVTPLLPGESKTATGEITLSAPDGLKEVTIGGRTFTVAELAALSVSSPSGVIDTGEGELQVIGLNVIAGDASAPTSAMLEYRYTLKAALDNSGAGEDIARTDDISLSITDMTTDAKPVEGMLTIRIVDDAPTATSDEASIGKNFSSVSGSVVSNDRVGADDPAPSGPVTGVQAGNSGGTDVSGNVGVAVTGTYGTLTLNADGSYSYVLDKNNAAVIALQYSQTLTETFSYTITDKDGDTSTAQLEITINGSDVPKAENDSYNTHPGGTVSGNLAGNDTPSLDGGNVWSVATGPAHGTVVVNADGTFTYTASSGYSGPDSFTYTITDKDGDTSTATVFVNVNDSPEASDDTFTTPYKTPVSGTLAGNDRPSLDGDNVWSVGTGPAHGTVVVNSDGTFTYTPDPGFTGSDSFTYTITDKDGDTSTATVNITVGENSKPVAVPDTVTTKPDTPISGNLAGNDTPSLDGGNVWSVATGPAHGTVVVNPDGTFTYTPDPGFTGSDSFTYRITDKDGDTSTTTVNIAVGENSKPVAVPDTVVTREDTPVSGNLAGNDTPSLDGGNEWSVATGPAHGTVVVNPDGTFTYTPDPGFTGSDSFTYIITDKDGDTSTATVNITVGENSKPVAVPDTVTTKEDTPVSGNLAGNDTPSLDGGNVWSVATGPAHGTVVVNPDGTFTYTPDPGFSGSDSFTYIITDKDGDTSTATVNITVGENSKPVAVPDTVVTKEDTPVSGSLAGNDTPSLDGGNAWSVATGPAHGTVVVNPDGTFTYTPDPGFSGSDSFTYIITDKDGDTSTATVNITVGENSKPVAVPDTVVTREDTPVSGSLAGNDTPSLDGDNVWSVATGPAHGTVVVNPDGTFTYTPDPGFTGSDSFTYTITDKDGDTSTATVIITVGENSKPVAVPDTVTTKPDTPVSGNLAGNDTPSLDGDNVWSVATGPAHGTVVVNPDGTFTYTPDPGFTGPDSFTYTITDKDGDTSTATVNITVGENSKPVAVPDTVTTKPDTPVSGNLAGNDMPSLDGGNVWSVATGPTHGTVVVNPDGTFTYTPAPGFTGTDSFTYTITDKDGDTSTATVIITVGENSKPVAVPDTVTTREDTPVSGSLAGNDTPSLDGDNVWSVATGPAHGTVVVNPDGTFTYTPSPGFTGSDSFTYTITDKDGDTSTATVIITVGENSKPVAVPDTVTTKPDTPVSGNLAGNDTPSLDGGNVWSVATGPAHGTVVVNPDGTFTYTPSPGFSGSDSFTYTITDKDGDTSTATVNITVGENSKPVAVPDTVTTKPDTPISGNLAGNDTPSLDGGNVWSVATGPAYGTVVVNPDGTFTYTPDPGFTGSDSFTYTITDKDGDTSTATVIITVGENSKPVAVPDTVTTKPDTPVSGNLAGNDTPSLDGGNVWSVATGPAHGTVVVNPDGTFTYTPSPGFSGSDSFTYTITDKDGDTSTATVIITVGVPDGTGGHHSGEKPGVSPSPTRPGGTSPATPGVGGIGGSFSPDGSGSSRLPLTVSGVFSPKVTEEQRILARALELSEFPRRLDIAYVQWIDLRFGQERTTVDLPPQALSVLTGTEIRSEARLADGSPLPFWIIFDPEARALVVTPPENLREKSVTVKIWLWDEKGNEAVVTIALNLDNTASQAGTGQNYFWETEQSIMVRPGEEVGVALPLEAQHTEMLTGDQLRISASLADGSPLPRGLELNPATGEVSGKVLGATTETVLDVRVTVTDEHGNRSEVIHHLHVIPGTEQAPPQGRASFSAQLAACMLV